MDVNTLGNIDAFSWMNVVKTKAKLLKGNVKKFLWDSDDKDSTVIANICWTNFDQKSLYKL